MIQSLPVLFILDSVHSGSARWDNCGPAFPDECFAVTLCPDPGDMVTVKPLKTRHLFRECALFYGHDFIHSFIYISM